MHRPPWLAIRATDALRQWRRRVVRLMTTLEVALLILCGLLAGGLLGALSEVRKLHREAWQYWLAQSKAQKEAHEARAALAEANKRLGALQATRGEVLEAAIATSKLAQLDALRQSDSSHTHHTR